MELKEIILIGSGACNDVYFLKTHDKSFALKIEKNIKVDLEVNSIKKEFLIIKKLTERKINLLPKSAEFIKTLNGFLYTYVKSETLDKTWPSLDSFGRKNILSDIIKFQSSIHKLGRIDDVDIKNGSCDILKYTKFLKSKVKKESGINNNLYRELLKIETILKSLSYKPLITLIHDDIHPGNLLIFNKKLCGIIDFGKIVYADVYKDFSHLISMYPEYTEYIINTYEKISGIKMSKKILLYYSILRDIEKSSYHLKKMVSKEASIKIKLKNIRNVF